MPLFFYACCKVVSEMCIDLLAKICYYLFIIIVSETISVKYVLLFRTLSKNHTTYIEKRGDAACFINLT